VMHGAKPQHHILSVLVENKFGVLSRVAGLFARRGFNIVSLAVSPTEDERFSRMTIVVDAESSPLEQITKQLNKLIPVIKIAELAADEAVERELMLVTVKATAEARSQITELASIFSVIWCKCLWACSGSCCTFTLIARKPCVSVGTSSSKVEFGGASAGPPP